MGLFFASFSAFAVFLIHYAPVGSNKSLLTMYRFDRAKSTKMKFVFFGNPLYRTLEKPNTFFAIRKMCSTRLLVFESRTVRFLVFRSELFVFRSSCLGQVQRLRSLPFDLFRLSHVGRIAEDGVFFPVQDLLHHTRIMDIGGRGDEAVDRLALPVHSYMDLHPEVVLVPLLRGVHIGIPASSPDSSSRTGR